MTRNIPRSSLWSKSVRLRQILLDPTNRSRPVRQIRTAIWAQFSNRILKRPVAVPLGQCSMLIADVRFSASMIPAYRKEPDFEEVRVWRRFLRRGDVFMDVGANVGMYSVLAGECGAFVIAIEPDTECVTQLTANMSMNKYPVEVHAVAVGDSVGQVLFKTDLDTMNRLALPGEADVVTTPCTTLDNVIGERVVTGMKIDVEGAERLVLQGAQRLLERGVPLLQIEWNDLCLSSLKESREPVYQILQAAGYTCHRPTASGQLVAIGGVPPYGSDVFAVQDSALQPEGRLWMLRASS